METLWEVPVLHSDNANFALVVVGGGNSARLGSTG